MEQQTNNIGKMIKAPNGLIGTIVNETLNHYEIKTSYNEVKLFIKSQCELLEQQTNEYKFERGEWVEVLSTSGKWVQKIYLSTIDGASEPFIVVKKGEEEAFHSGKPFNMGVSNGIRKLQQPKEKEIDWSGITDDPKIIEVFNSILNLCTRK